MALSPLEAGWRGARGRLPRAPWGRVRRRRRGGTSLDRVVSGLGAAPGTGRIEMQAPLHAALPDPGPVGGGARVVDRPGRPTAAEGSKPGSVPGASPGEVISLGRRSPDASRGLPEARRGGPPLASYLALLPEGFAVPPAVAGERGGLLPHPCTLARASGARSRGTRGRRRRSALCCTGRRLAAPGCSPAPCPAQPGLSSNRATDAAGRPGPRRRGRSATSRSLHPLGPSARARARWGRRPSVGRSAGLLRRRRLLPPAAGESSGAVEAGYGRSTR